MRKMTKSNLEAAFAGESQAHMRYLIFAGEAEKEGFPQVARLFRAIAFAEQVHATNHLRTLGGVGESPANLQVAIDGETFEVDEMYPAYKAVAELQEEKGAVRSTHYALEAEKVHAGMYQRARQSVLTGKDVEIGDIYICEVCGWTVEGEAPERCPICGATRDKFRKF
ncbi:MAG: rubrerythrin family protein [Anaerolineae bacterium]